MGKLSEFLSDTTKMNAGFKEAFGKYESQKAGFIEERNIRKAIEHICMTIANQIPPSEVFEDLDENSDEGFDFDQFSRITVDFLKSLNVDI